ncbi:hypothetical protein PMIN02_008684 [Paraphaeosphaeria minitans]|uniref:Uncharacterized protein n=1 Tax=Paraphaeosphaeria minitans TaxID=565426 RepID=A0A9P6GVK7_9PLEO|nr:hypothetical protein PMIN01_01424 [Paraphaeosphaeria minitans]
MAACGISTSTGWPQLSTELKLEILWHLLAVDVGKEEQEVTPVKYGDTDTIPDPGQYGIDRYKHGQAMKKTLGPLIATGNRELAALAQEVYYSSSFFVVECRETSVSGPNLSKAHLIRRLLVVVGRFEIPTGVRCSQADDTRCLGLLGNYHPTLFILRTEQSIKCKSHGRNIEQWADLAGWSAWQLRFNHLDRLYFRFVFLQEDHSKDCINQYGYEYFMNNVMIGLTARVVSFRFYPYDHKHWNDCLRPTLPDVSGFIRHRCICAQGLEQAFHRLMKSVKSGGVGCLD